MNITKTYNKLIVFAASISVLNTATFPAVAALTNYPVESSSNKTKVSLHFSNTEKDSSQLAKAGNKGVCDVNPSVCK